MTSSSLPSATVTQQSSSSKLQLFCKLYLHPQSLWLLCSAQDVDKPALPRQPPVLVSPHAGWQHLPLQLSQASPACQQFVVPSQAVPQKDLVFNPQPPITPEEWQMLSTLANQLFGSQGGLKNFMLMCNVD